MKQFISRVKNLSQKAAEFKAAMQQVPPKVAEIRETVAATRGQLRQLKAEMQYSVADLQADDEDRLSAALQEINSSEDVLAKAGFVISSVELDISPAQRLLVHLTKLDDVHPSVLRSLMSSSQNRRTIHAILSALLQAKQMAETIRFTQLGHDEVVIGVGPIPSVRLRWHPEEAVEEEVAPAQSEIQQPSAPAASTATVQSMFGPGAFFEKRPTSAEPASVPVKPGPAGTKLPVTPSTEEAEEVEVAGESKVSPAPATQVDPLARFKKMPDFSKYRK